MEMIVISPTDESESYFTEFSTRVLKSYLEREPSTESNMKDDNKTLTISCDLEVDNGNVKIKLHYRYLKDVLYCFVEEV